MKRIAIVLIAILSLALLVGVVGCSSSTESTEPAAETEEVVPEEPAAEETTDPTAALVESKCSLCHTTERVWEADYDRATWETTVDRMKANGLVITDEEYEEVVTYLSE